MKEKEKGERDRKSRNGCLFPLDADLVSGCINYQVKREKERER